MWALVWVSSGTFCGPQRRTECSKNSEDSFVMDAENDDDVTVLKLAVSSANRRKKYDTEGPSSAQQT